MQAWLAKLPTFPLRKSVEEKDYLPVATSSNASTPTIYLDVEDEDEDDSASRSLLKRALGRTHRKVPRWSIALAAACLCLLTGAIILHVACADNDGWQTITSPWTWSAAWNDSAITVGDFRDEQVTTWLVSDGTVEFGEDVAAVFLGEGARIGWTADGEPLGLVPEFVTHNETLVPGRPETTLLRDPTTIFPDPSLYRPIKVDALPTGKSRDWMTTLRPTRFLPDEGGCLDEWFSSGTLCEAASSGLLGVEEKLDLIYLWVNGTDPIWRTEQQRTVEKNPNAPNSPPRHFRERGELQYTMRSVAKAFRAADALRKVHVVTMDMAVPMPISNDTEAVTSEAENARWRISQVPQWHDVDVTGSISGDSGKPQLQWHSHREIFRLPASYMPAATDLQVDKVASPVDQRWQSEESWRRSALPTYNSFAIETMLGWMDDLSDYAVQANDDMFFLSDLAAADFYSPLLGVVSRLDPGLTVRPQMSKTADSGEWGGLQHASWLLSQRFPERPRNYIIHAPKVLSLPITQEAVSIWTDEYAVAATRPFRESQAGQGDIENAFIVTHLRIERWREALLWSWIVAKMGGTEGVWGDAARWEVKGLLGVVEGVVSIKRIERSTPDSEDLVSLFRPIGWTAPLKTKILHDAMDGHLTSDWRKPKAECELNVTACFGSDFLSGQDQSAASMFQRLAFAKHECGDCLIQALIGQSGEAGISAFLPDKGSLYKPAVFDNGDTVTPPHLPLTKTWEEADFSLAANIRPRSDLLDNPLPDGMIDLRTWTLKLLSRYQYVVGDTDVAFQGLRSAGQAEGIFRSINADGGTAMACLNDDAPAWAADAVQKAMQKWMQERWTDKDKVWWEK